MIRLATEQDLPLVGSIYEEILAEEEKRPASFTNWQRGKYPTVEHARAALEAGTLYVACLLYTSPSPRDLSTSRMPSSA